MFLTIEHHVETAVEPSERVLQIAAMFGLGVDEQRRLSVVPASRVPLPAGGLVFITGPSGGGKTTILELIAEEAQRQDLPVIRADELPQLADVPLVDAFDLPLERISSLLARVGLGDAFVMLRKPRELSDGQRYRLRLAQIIDIAERAPGSAVILADEFGATLDRLTARTIARNLRRWISTTTHTFICATTHDDLLEALEPDVLIYKDLCEQIEIFERKTQRNKTDGEDTRETSHQPGNPSRP